MLRAFVSVCGLLVAVLFSQFPEYAQQYAQRLGGAVDELAVIVEDFDSGARAAGLGREEALERFSAAPDAFVAGRGTAMQATLTRYETLVTALGEIEGATGLERALRLPLYLDTDVGARTLENFRPAVPVTLEGIAWALSGFCLGALLALGLGKACRAGYRRYRYPVRRGY